MKSSPTIRFLDRYVGSFGCWILSGISKFLRSPGPSLEIKKLLFIELFEMGASIMACPSIHFIKKEYPEVEIYALTTKGIRSSWMILDEIPMENVFIIDDSNLLSFASSFIRNIIAINRKGIDVIIDLELFFRISAIISFFIKASVKAGFSRYNLEGLYRGTVYRTPCFYNQNTHIARNFLALTKTAMKNGGDIPEYKNSIPVEDLVLAEYQAKTGVFKSVQEKFGIGEGENYIVISPDVGLNLSCRNYPLEMLGVAVSSLLSEFLDYRVFLIGTRENIPICNQLEGIMNHPRVRSIANQTTMEELFELLLHARLLISNDNGPVHFAALTSTPTIALYSTDSPYVYGSLGKCVILYSFYQCSPCIMAYNHKNSSCTDNKCLKAIPPESLSSLASRILRNDASVNFRTINNKIPYLF